MSVIPLRSAAARCCSTADSIVPRTSSGPEVEQHEPRVELRELEQVLGEPVEPVELDCADESRNSARAAGSAPAGPWSSST